MVIKASIKVQSKQQKVIRLKVDEWKIYLLSPARENKANLELVQVISKELGVPKSRVSIIRGNKSKEKLVQIIEA